MLGVKKVSVRIDTGLKGEFERVLDGIGLDRRGVPRGQIPALHGTLLPQRAGQGPQIQALPGRGHAQGDPRDEIARRVGGKGGIRRRRARVDGAQGGGEGGSRGLHRDADVLRNTARALAAHPHE